MVNDITKLPKWAQAKIYKLEQDLNSAKELIETFNGKKSRVYCQRWLEDSNFYLGDTETISFDLGEEKQRRRYDSDIVSVRYSPENWFGFPAIRVSSDDIIVMPGSSNTIYISTGILAKNAKT